MAHEDGHYQPLPQIPNWDEDRLRQFFHRQTISAQKLITGSLQADQTVSSSNFSSGSAGWQIDGDGNAEFNDVTVRGDIESSNWNGTSPADLSSRDGGASTGFYLDSSEGAAQFEGDVFVGGTLNLFGTGGLTTSTSGQRMVISGSGNILQFYSDNNNEVSPAELRLQIISSTEADFDIIGPDVTGLTTTALVSLGDDGGIRFRPGDVGTVSITNGGQFQAEDGNASNPGIAFRGDTNTGIYRSTANHLAITTGGSLAAEFSSVGTIRAGGDGTSSNAAFGFKNDLDTGMSRTGDNQLRLFAGGTQKLMVSSTVSAFDGINDATTGSAANVFVNSSNGALARSTSSLKYKPDWRPAPEAVDYELPPPIKWTDENGQLRLGFGAEQVWEKVPEAYESEIYDLRSLVAILSEKVKRLEEALGQRNKLPSS